MSSEDSEPAPPVESVVAEKLEDLPASTPSEATEPSAAAAATERGIEDISAPPSKPRLFNRQRSVHHILGGGKTADVFLWRDKFMSAGILAGATVVYFLLEYSGCTLLSILSNLLLVTFGVLFAWSNVAVFINRSPPPLPNLNISEDEARSLALAVRAELNKVLAAAHDIALGKDFKLFLKVIVVLWGLATVGGWFHFLTLVYLAVVLAHSIPVIYERYEDQIESYAKIALDEAHKHYRKIDAAVLSKLPKKKTQ